MSGSTQANLAAFDEQSTDSANSTEQAKETSSPGAASGTESSGRHHCQSARGVELYVDLAERACNQIPREAHDMVGVTSLSPPQRVVTTSLPDEIPALPKRVGNWRLIEASEDSVRYHVTGKAYDERYGAGGGNQEVEVYFNDSGVNKDYQYHRRNRNIVGFENGAKIRTFTPDEGQSLSRCKWFSPSQNTGDRGVSGGSSEKFESYYEAVLSLLQYLHFSPAPFGRFLPTDLESGWELQKLEPLFAVYEGALSGSDKEYVSFIVRGSTVKVKAYDENDSVRDIWTGAVPADCCEYPDAVSHRDRGTDATTAAVAVQAAIQMLQESPQSVFSMTGFEQ